MNGGAHDGRREGDVDAVLPAEPTQRRVLQRPAEVEEDAHGGTVRPGLQDRDGQAGEADRVAGRERIRGVAEETGRGVGEEATVES